MSSLNKIFSLMMLLATAITLGVMAQHAGAATPTWTAHIDAMKQAERGPFRRLRWFCNDGSVLPPEPYACRSHGGGVQHGEYSAVTREIRNAGYPIATLLADLQPADILQSNDGGALLRFMLVEQFLIGFDDGWIFRQARYYRGAVQHEDEQRSGQQLLEALAAQPQWVSERFLLLREAARLLPHENRHVSLATVRGLAASIADRDHGFRGLRGKIHGRPDAGDASRVREYARREGQPDLQSEYQRLAKAIDQAYRQTSLTALLAVAAGHAAGEKLQADLHALSRHAADQPDATRRLQLATTGMALIRARLAQEPAGAGRVALLDSSLQLERLAFVAARDLDQHTEVSRRALLDRIRFNTDGLYGSGLITAPEHREVLVSLEQIDDEPLALDRYRQELRHLGMVSEWAAGQLRFFFADTIEKFSDLEPLAELYIADRLRSSPLLSYDETHAALALDAQAASQVRHEVFGRPVVGGLRSLNPGLARGPLYIAGHDTPMADFDAHGIYIVPETLPKLPPVAGIITLSEGNALSHVQLLARNLGIPNIVVSDDLLGRFEPHIGKRVVIAASGGGVVRIAPDSFEWDNVFRAGADAERAPLRINTDKLQLDRTRLYPLHRLSGKHSGRVVGPKAARLGELMDRFPGQVAPGLAIPFGTYRQLLDQPAKAGASISMFEWLRQSYSRLEQLRRDDPVAYEQHLDQVLDFARRWFMQAELPDGFEKRLRRAMQRQFGEEGSYGVFVRSDTNVEDLPQFSGAGLNLTVPNVVGFENTLDAVRRVWASAFTRRAFSWRQALMDQPEHVYASVLLQRGIPSEKSGVLVTQDVDSGDRDVATVVVNEGVGGGVDGQLAEMLKIDLHSDRVRRLSSATATQRRILLPAGGSKLVPASGAAAVLDTVEIAALRQLSRSVPLRMPEFAAAPERRPPAADIEFGFYDGKLWLFQVRPLVESEAANRNSYLNALDAGLRNTAKQLIDLDRPPGTLAS